MLNSEYKLSQSSVQSQQLAKNYQKQRNNHGIHCPILILVPSETLTAITSYLDPPSLCALAVVNVYLNGHIKDDNTWRRAFFYQFLGIGPENDLNDNQALLLRRTERSWRNEFTVRCILKRRWERSRSTVTTHIPVNSPISSMHVMPSHALLTSSIQYGIVARSLPLTGRILPGYLDTSGGARVGLGIGNPNAEFTPNISACAVSSDGGTAKIAWGTRAGDVLFMNAPKAMDNGRRNATDVRRCDILDKHEGSVLDVQWVLNAPSSLAWTVVTASADGRIKLWDAKTAVCQWTSQTQSNAVIRDQCLKVTATQTGAHGGCIATVMKSGEIHLWTGFTLGSIAIYQESSIRDTIIECPICTSTPGYDPQATHAVLALHIDPNPTSAFTTLLVAYENDPLFYRIRVGPEKVDIIAFGEPSFGSTSIIVPYFSMAEEQASFVLVGDHLGWVSLYAWDADNPNATIIRPIRKFEAHPDGTSITALTWSPHTLITGSARGTTHVFDALSFRNIRSFASPIRRRNRGGGADEAAAERDRQKVKQIIVGTGPSSAALNLTTSSGNSKNKGLSMEEDRDVIFVSVGERVMAWKAGPVPKYGHGGVRARHIRGALVGKQKKLGYGKYLQQLEVKRTMLESRHDHHQLLLDELKYKKHLPSEYAREREREQREGLEHLGLSEVEAVEYVLMLSRDEANANPKGGSGASTSETQFEEDQAVFECDFDTEHNTDNDEEDDRDRSFPHSTGSGSRRSSISSTSIPTTSSSSSSSASISSRSSHSNLTTMTRTTSTGLTTTAIRRSIPRPIPSSSNEKIQVSPPFRAEPMEAGEEWSVAYNPVRSDPSSTSGDNHTSAEVELEAHIFPPIVPDGIRNAGNEAQELKREDDENNKRQNDSKRKKKNKNKKDSKDKFQGSDKGKFSSLSLNSISDADALTSSPPSSSTSPTSPSTSAWNIPSSTGQNYGQRRASNISNPSSTSTSASASVSATIAPRNAWTSGGPRSLSARISPPSAAAAGSLHYHHRYQQQQGGSRDTDMDEDLQFAIELSLVEARSRGEDV